LVMVVKSETKKWESRHALLLKQRQAKSLTGAG
jgi:hypothetical protein